MKEAKGSFTVEAVLLMPALIVLSMVLIYYTIYVYDRAMMKQDLEGISSAKWVSGLQSEDGITEVEKSHPYISVKNLTAGFSEDGKKASIKGEWELPIMDKYNASLEFEKDIFTVDPIKIMFRTEQIKKLWRIYDNSDGI